MKTLALWWRTRTVPPDVEYRCVDGEAIPEPHRRSQQVTKPSIWWFDWPESLRIVSYGAFPPKFTGLALADEVHAESNPEPAIIQTSRENRSMAIVLYLFYSSWCVHGQADEEEDTPMGQTDPKTMEMLYLFISESPTAEDLEAIQLLRELPYKWQIVHVDPQKRATPALDAYPLGYQILQGIRTVRDFVLDQQEELGLKKQQLA